jgi:hypothetical protein
MRARFEHVPTVGWLVVLLVACTPSAPVDPLDPAQIEDVAKSEGDAAGSDRSGGYRIELTSTPDCDCPSVREVDLCNSNVSALARGAGRATLSQTEGFLLITEDMGLLSLSGAIEASGAFDVAAIHGFASALGEIALYARVTGDFTGPDRFTGTVQTRFLGEFDGDDIDCRTEAAVAGVRTLDPESP